MDKIEVKNVVLLNIKWKYNYACDNKYYNSRSFEIVLAYLIQSIIDQAAPDTISMIGASLVCLGNTL